ncbi:MAG: hypothetical protein JNM18_20050 [Planctomycetaceae bacterium]|nr:hypothetical protein [Planctomycetaceae bacterium]
MQRRQLMQALALGGIATLWPSFAAAQKGGKGGGGKGGGKGGGGKGGKGKDDKEKNLTDVSGTIKGILPQGVLIESDDGKKYLASLTTDALIELTGEADTSLFAIGAFIEFEAVLDRQGNVVDEVEAITFVEPNALNPLGVFPTSLPSDAKDNANDAAKSTFLVRGRVQSPRAGQLLVQAGGKNMPVKVSAELALAARFNSLAYASNGDNISARVELVPQPNVGVIRVIGHEFSITTASPIQSPKAKRDTKPAEKPTADKS